MIKVTDVNTEDVDKLWPEVRGYLENALAFGAQEFSIGDVYLSIKDEMSRLWIAYDDVNKQLLGSAVCIIQNFPQKRICTIVLAGGEGHLFWDKGIPEIEDWAKQHNADMVMIYGRRGFAKKLFNYGYREAYTVILKDLLERRLDS